MAEGKITVSVEASIYRAFEDLAKSIAEQHGVLVHQVSYTWLDASSLSEQKAVLVRTAMTTSKGPAE